jgi:hypothetical protein
MQRAKALKLVEGWFDACIAADDLNVRAPITKDDWIVLRVPVSAPGLYALAIEKPPPVVRVPTGQIAERAAGPLPESVADLPAVEPGPANALAAVSASAAKAAKMIVNRRIPLIFWRPYSVAS